MNILIIEDETNISFALERFFSGMGSRVKTCASLAEAYRIHPARQDFIILDLNLPDGEGFEYLSFIRQQKIRTPLLILTVRDQEKDILRGLSMGADDYLTKPFSLPVLKARMEAILRRIAHKADGRLLKYGGLTLDKLNRRVFIDEKPVVLGQTEYELLQLFLENQGLTLPRERIMDALWGWERGHVYDNTLSVTVKRLREKISPYQDYIRTVRGIGYRLTEEER